MRNKAPIQTQNLNEQDVEMLSDNDPFSAADFQNRILGIEDIEARFQAFLDAFKNKGSKRGTRVIWFGIVNKNGPSDNTRPEKRISDPRALEMFSNIPGAVHKSLKCLVSDEDKTRALKQLTFAGIDTGYRLIGNDLVFKEAVSRKRKNDKYQSPATKRLKLQNPEYDVNLVAKIGEIYNNISAKNRDLSLDFSVELWAEIRTGILTADNPTETLFALLKVLVRKTAKNTLLHAFLSPPGNEKDKTYCTKRQVYEPSKDLLLKGNNLERAKALLDESTERPNQTQLEQHVRSPKVVKQDKVLESDKKNTEEAMEVQPEFSLKANSNKNILFFDHESVQKAFPLAEVQTNEKASIDDFNHFFKFWNSIDCEGQRIRNQFIEEGLIKPSSEEIESKSLYEEAVIKK